MAIERPFRQNGFSIGQTLQLYKKLKVALDSRTDAGHNIRVRVADKIIELSPEWDNPNFKKGTIIGGMIAAIAAVIDEYVPLKADADIVNTEPVEGGTRYTVNVDAPLKPQAMFKAMIESGSGFVSILSDDFDVKEPVPSRKRLARDTWTVDVVVKDPDLEAEPAISLGLLS